MLTDEERVLIRRIFGYPHEQVPFGHWRYYVEFGDFEFKCNNLSEDQVSNIREALDATRLIIKGIIHAI